MPEKLTSLKIIRGTIRFVVVLCILFVLNTLAYYFRGIGDPTLNGISGGVGVVALLLGKCLEHFDERITNIEQSLSKCEL
jgi:hypothetical protein